MQRPTMLAVVAVGVLLFAIHPVHSAENGGPADTVDTSGYLTYGDDVTHARVTVFNSNSTSGTDEPLPPCQVEVSVYDGSFSPLAQEAIEVHPQRSGNLTVALPAGPFPDSQVRADVAYLADGLCRPRTINGSVELLNLPGGQVVARHGLAVRATPEPPPAPEPPAPEIGRPLTIALAAPRLVWSGRSTTMTLRYKNLKGWGIAAIELPPEIAVISSIPAATSIEDGTVRYDRLASGSGAIKLRVEVAPGLERGTRLEATATMVGEVGTPVNWGIEMTIR